MTERGHYRAIHAVLVDSPEFQDLSPEAMAVWLQIKLRLGASGIGVLYEGTIQGALPKASERVPGALAELEAGTWISREGPVIWLRNGLKWDPHISLAHDKQRAGVEGHLKALPKLKIVNDFAAYYGLPEPFGSAKTICKDGESPPKDSPETIPKREKGEGKGEGRRQEVSPPKPSRISTTLPPTESARREGVHANAGKEARGFLRDVCLRGREEVTIEGAPIGLGLLVAQFQRMADLGTYQPDELRGALQTARFLPHDHPDRAPDGPFTLAWIDASPGRIHRLVGEARKRAEPPAVRGGGLTPIGDVLAIGARA